MTHTTSAPQLFHSPTRSVRRASGLVLVAYPEASVDLLRCTLACESDPDLSRTSTCVNRTWEDEFLA